MRNDTKYRLLNISEEVFAERGFYGASIAMIAEQMGFSKQALLHHYVTKEKLYGAVLQRISDDFLLQQRAALEVSPDPLECLSAFYVSLATPNDANRRRTRLLMRELLDNNARAGNTENWYLKAFLTNLVQMVKAIDALKNIDDEEALVIAYQWLGAVNYFLISPATLKGIYGEASLDRMRDAFKPQLAHLIQAHISKAHIASN